MDQSLNCRTQAFLRSEHQPRSVRLHNLRIGSESTCNDGCSLAKGFQQDHRKDLVTPRRRNYRPRIQVELTHALCWLLPEKTHIRKSSRELSQGWRIGPLTGDPELRRHVGAEERNHVLETLDHLEPTRKEEVGFLGGAGFERSPLARGGRWENRGFRQEERKDLHFPLESEFPVFRGAEESRREIDIHMRSMSIEEIRVAPELWRSVVSQLTTDAFASRTDLSIVSPQDVRGADQPVLVGCVDFDPSRSVREQARPSNQRYVMEVENIRIDLRNKSGNFRPMHQGPAKLLRSEARECRPAALERVKRDPLGIWIRIGRV